MPPTIAIIGGGISGLSAAYYLSKWKHAKILLFEASNCLGGWINSLRLEDGSIFERGPRSIRGIGRAGYNTLELADELGLTDNVIPVPKTSPAAKNRYIYVNGQLFVMPNSLTSVFFRHPPFTKPLFLHGLMEPFQRRSTTDDESVDSFFRRRCGNDIAKFAADPLCRGVFAGDSKTLSMRSCFPIFYNFEKNYGSIVLGSMFQPQDKTILKSELIKKFRTEKWSMWSLKDGLQGLPEAINHYLRNSSSVEIHLQRVCTSTDFTGKNVKVNFGSDSVKVDHVISALPSYELSKLVSVKHRELGNLLQDIEFASVAVVNLQYRSNVFGIEGFGHLIPSHELPSVLGVIYESCSFPQHNGLDNSTRITVMLGGAWFDEMFGNIETCDVNKITDLAVETVSKQLHISERPYRVMPHIHKKCIPQYRVGHWKTIDQIMTYINGNQLPLTLIGASYKGVSVNDCIYNTRLEMMKLTNLLDMT